MKQDEESFHHLPVLLDDVLEGLRPYTGGRYVDCTVGGGGHSRAILAASSPSGRLLGLDQDPAALQAAGETLNAFGRRVTLRKANFRRLLDTAREAGFDQADGVLFDIGVSSPQLDEGERGFSFHQDAPLDMRMDPDGPVTARDLVNELEVPDLTRILQDYGEERWARRIAEFIVRNRPLETTGQLVEVIKAAIPAAARRSGPHPARRTFQALRIAVNDELGALEEGLGQALELVRPGGRVAVITFHSLEDRIVKQAMQDWARGCICPPDLPICVCGRKPRARLVTRKPVSAGEEEVSRNPRSRSAKLRVAEKLAAE
ncbi:MAG: 16S rRNA (cytosine(1402)-N(4))-methyltransferase RsmH [Bacillota bacterium]